MNKAIAAFATNRPRTVYAIVLALTLVTGVLMTGIRIDTDPENMLPADQPERVFHDMIEDRFSLNDAIVVGMVNDTDPDGIYNAKSLAALHALSKSILQIDGVITPDLMSLSEVDNIDQAGPGTIRFEWMMKDAPATERQAQDIRDKVARLPLLMDTLVSGDGKAAGIYIPIESKDLSYPISLKIRALADALDVDDAFHITGLPVAEDTFGHDMFVQMGISAPLAGLMIFLLMLYFFRSVPFVVAPMLVAMATVIITMGLLIGAGFTVHIMSSMIPIFLMPIAVVDSVHILSEFSDAYRSGKDARAVIGHVLDHLFKPMLFTSLTSATGFLSLLLTPIPPVQIFGAFVALGILIAFVLTITLVPAYIVRMKPASLDKLAARSNADPGDTPLARMLRRLGAAAVRRAGAIIAVAVLVTGVSIAGVFRIQINDNPVRWFKASHPIRVADDVLNDHFAGTYDAFVVLSTKGSDAVADFRRAAEPLLVALPTDLLPAMRDLVETDADDVSAYFGDIIAAADDALFEANDDATVEALEQLMQAAESAQSASKYFQRPAILGQIAGIQDALAESGLVGKTNALPDVVKVVNRELRGGDAADYRLPDTQPAVAQTLLQYQSSHRPQDLWHMVTPDYTSTAIWLQLKSGDNQDMSRVMDALDDYLAAHPLPPEVSVAWAGKTYINVVWQDAMVNGMLNSLAGAFVVVFVMMAALFRSLRLGLLAMVPLTITILGVYGIVGWMGKDYDMPIAVLSSLTLGLSVDFAIHFIERSRALLRQYGDIGTAMQRLFEEPARAISRNAIVIAIGFTPLFFAPLVPYITVGAFMAGIMALSAVATLVILPAIIARAGPWLFRESGRDPVATAHQSEAV